ncbi:MAG: bifunctional nuclease family protein, partial [Nitrospiraceae bacterium]
SEFGSHARSHGTFLMITQMKVRGLMFDPYNNTFIVLLRDEEQAEMLPIWVGKPEASAISFALEGVTAPRPMTHDLMKSILDAVHAKVISVVISDLKDNTYYAKVHLSYEDSEYAIDSRPSDAIALALRTKAPIFANEDVLRKQASEELDQWLENLKPEDFGKYDV